MNFENHEQFVQKQKEIAGETCTLIYPSEMGVDWTVNNLNFRSVIVNSENRVISAGFPKFFNYGEKPDLYPSPENCNDWVIDDKLDGSLLIVSQYKGELIIRTRGTFNAFQHENGEELKKLLEKYTKVTDNFWVKYEKYTLLFEWISTARPIVIKYDKPELVLLGMIRHSDYNLASSNVLDFLSISLKVPRPKKFKFSKIAEIGSTLTELKNVEGYVLSYNGNQNRVKLKTIDYLKKHKFRSNCTFNSIFELWEANGCPIMDDLCRIIEKQFDYECLQMAKPQIEELHDFVLMAHDLFDKISFDIFSHNLREISKKDAAAIINTVFEEKYRGLYFSELSNKKKNLAKVVWDFYKSV